MDALSAALEIKALDGLSARSDAIAQNIANASTVGYRPVRVDFEGALRAAAGGGPDAVAGVRPRLALDPAGAADGVRLDLEMAGAAATGQRYAALVDILSRQLELDGVAILGNR